MKRLRRLRDVGAEPHDTPYADQFLRKMPKDRQELEEELWDVELPKEQVPE